MQAAEEPGARAVVARRPTFWRRIRQGTLPEGLWLTELKREAAPLLGGKTPRQWLKLLNSSNAHVRQEALRAYLALPPVPRCLLTAEAYREGERYGCNVSAIAVLSGILILIAGAAIGEAGGFACAAVLAILFGSVVTSYLRTSRPHELAKDLLDSANNARLIPFLARRLRPVQNDSWRRRQMFGGRNLRNALVRLLPLVQEADAVEWTGVHWDSVLCYLRNPYADIILTHAVMYAAARVGNEEAYRRIAAMRLGLLAEERMRRGDRRAAADANQQILMQAQQECLPVLEARVRAQRQVQTLLRPAASSLAPAKDILLRPADAHADTTPAEQLLRSQSRE